MVRALDYLLAAFVFVGIFTLSVADTADGQAPPMFAGEIGQKNGHQDIPNAHKARPDVEGSNTTYGAEADADLPGGEDVVHQAHILGDRVLRLGFTYGWSGWFGGWGGELGIKKVCRSGFITSFALATGNEAVGEVGLSMIGTVTCSDGSQIVCCDGGRRMGDQSASLTSSSGFQSIKVRSGSVVRGLCAQERCIGADGNEFEITCAHNRVLTGFQARAGKVLDAVRFLCAEKHDSGSVVELPCPRLFPLPSKWCPTTLSLLPCQDAAFYSMCLADGKCGARVMLKNCKSSRGAYSDASVYLKV